ncbi:MAG: LLM class flavin-dependent oxidoreductase [Chloroflexi bacterium]|nr:LLM class flavin-dependent oxidoreductase [Chloroflexota bacterium]MCI0895480.1 LLM class flavin-dependent oxidoreductase [Chloroflexota bacterium]
MSENRIGVAISGNNIAELQGAIQHAEQLGIHGAWMTTGGARPDSLTVFAASAGSTSSIMLGTSIVPIYPRHPLVMVQQTQVVAQLAPGRFRLGVGPSHRPTMEAAGIEFRAPLAHLREYLRILKALLQTGRVDFDGRYYSAHESIPEPLDVPVMGSALRRGAFELCGEEADGAISWICPGTYLRDVGLPALQAGARKAGRPVPPLIAHAPVCVSTNAEEVRAAVRQQIMNPRLPFYQQMLIDAGFPEAAEGTWSDGMIDAVVIWGDETKVADGLQQLFSFGATEVLASPVAAGDDRAASLERTLSLLGQVSQSMPRN